MSTRAGECAWIERRLANRIPKKSKESVSIKSSSERADAYTIELVVHDDAVSFAAIKRIFWFCKGLFVTTPRFDFDAKKMPSSRLEIYISKPFTLRRITMLACMLAAKVCVAFVAGRCFWISSV